MNYLIIEDEKNNAVLLRNFIKKIRPEWHSIMVLDKVSSSIEWLNSNENADLIFMDIQLKDGICFSILEEAKISSPVIFTTAYDEYAIRAFEVNSIDYLLKPIEQNKLEHAINKFEKYHEQKKQIPQNIDEILNVLMSGKKEYRNRFLISGPRNYFKIDAREVAYIRSEAGICTLVLFSGNEHIIDYTLEKLEHQLDPKSFFRANRSIMLNSEAILKFENYFGGKLVIHLIAPFNNPVYISRLKAGDFKRWLDT